MENRILGLVIASALFAMPSVGSAQDHRNDRVHRVTPSAANHWGRSSADWVRHQRACQKRSRSYNPRTDRYVVRHGQTTVCRL